MSLGLGSTDTLITGAPSFFLMAPRRGYSAFIIAASLLMLSGLSALYLETDGSDGINEGFTWERNGDDVTVTGHGTLGYDSSWNGLKTLTLVPEGGTIDIESHAFEDCGSLTTVTFNGSVGSIGENAFTNCGSMTTVTIVASGLENSTCSVTIWWSRI